MPPKYVNTVPHGVAGTGNATIYGANPVAAQFGNQLAAMRQQEYQDELLRRKAIEDEAKRTAASWQKNLLKADGGLYWQPEFDKRTHDFIQKGVGLRQAGINPWGTNPAHAKETMDFLLEKQGLENDFLTRKDKETAVTEQFKLLKGDPSAFRPASIRALNEYISKPFSQARSEPVPQLQKAYDPEAELYSKVSGKAFTTPTTTRVEYPDPKDMTKDERVTYREVILPETKRLVESTLLGTRDGINYVEDQTGVPLTQLNSIPKTLEEVKKLPEFTWDGNPGLQQQMATNGIDTKEKAQPILDKMAREYFRPRQVYDQIVETGVQRATAGVNLVDSRLPDQTRFNQQEKLKADELARQRLAISRQNAAKKGAATTSADVRRDLIQRIRNVDPNALDELVAAGNAMGGYDTNDEFKIIGTGTGGKPGKVAPGKGTVKLHIPAKVKTEDDLYNPGQQKTTVATPARDVLIDLGSPNFETFMNTLIGDITGAKVDIGSFGAKSSNLKKSPPSTVVKALTSAPAKVTTVGKIKALVGKKGYEGYTEKELIDYYKSQGYTIK